MKKCTCPGHCQFHSKGVKKPRQKTKKSNAIKDNPAQDLDDMGLGSPVLPTVIPNAPKAIQRVQASSIEDKLNLAGLDPLVMMIQFAQDPNLTPELRFAALKELSGYMYAKKKKSNENNRNLDLIQAKVDELQKLSDEEIGKAAREHWNRMRKE